MRTRIAVGAVAVMLAAMPAMVIASEDSMEPTTLVVDLQPDPGTLKLLDTNGDGAPSAGEFFSVSGDLYEPGTDTDIGDFICRGVFLADVEITALDAAPTVTGGVAGQFSQVQQTYVIDGVGSLEVLGTEPGLPGRAVSGGTGEYAGMSGDVLFEFILGATLDPPFIAPAVAGVDASFLSGRLTFSLLPPS